MTARKPKPPAKPQVGRPRAFATPEDLLQGALDYFEWADANPWLKNEALKKPYQRPKLGKSGQPLKGQMEWVYMVQVPTQRPYSLAGFAVYHALNQQFILDLESRMKAQEKEGATEKARAEACEFLSVIAYVREAIATNQLEGASVGAYNANIIARLLGLVDKKDVTSDGESTNKGFYDLVRQLRMKKQEGGNQ
ncbi:terminase small subunit [Flaviaesturariibacter amylovorans]|uniref:Terminase small subunit n=1 Tax=Flaviaesturariibacter amylovorans TaxID=1084520 RepID=A0ABP8GQC3_9BACT